MFIGETKMTEYFKAYVTSMMVIIFWDFLIFLQIFLSPQVKQGIIISNKKGIHELPHDLRNNLRFRIFGN